MRLSLYGLTSLTLLIGTICFIAPMAFASASSNGINQLAKEKTESEGAARRFKRKHPKQDVIYDEIEKDYTKAKAAYDGFVAQIKFDLASGKDFGKSADCQQSLVEAARKSAAFRAHADQPDSRANLAEAVATLLPGITTSLRESGITIFHEWRAANKEDQAELKKQIDELKWADFDEIKISK